MEFLVERIIEKVNADKLGLTKKEYLVSLGGKLPEKMPDCKRDYEHFASLHSWYKHFHGSVHYLYPVLLPDWQEGNYNFPDPTDELHWHFILLDMRLMQYYKSLEMVQSKADHQFIQIDIDNIKTSEELFGTLPIDLMKEHRIAVDSNICWMGPIKDFQDKCMQQACKEFWTKLHDKMTF